MNYIQGISIFSTSTSHATQPLSFHGLFVGRHHHSSNYLSDGASNATKGRGLEGDQVYICPISILLGVGDNKFGIKKW